MKHSHNLYAKWLGIRFWWTVCRPQESFAKIFCCKWSVWRESVSRTAFIVCTLYCNFWCEAGKWKVSTAVRRGDFLLYWLVLTSTCYVTEKSKRYFCRRYKRLSIISFHEFHLWIFEIRFSWYSDGIMPSRLKRTMRYKKLILIEYKTDSGPFK